MINDQFGPRVSSAPIVDNGLSAGRLQPCLFSWPVRLIMRWMASRCRSMAGSMWKTTHAHALYKVATTGLVGETYNIGGHNEKQNFDVVHTVCDLPDEMVPLSPSPLAGEGPGMREKSYRDQITYVADRPGHDRRYAIDATKMSAELAWQPQETFESGIRKTVQWYLDNQQWVSNVKSGAYQSWIEQNYGERA